MGQDGITELADLDAAWRGWRLCRGELVSPEGWRFTPGAVRAGELYRRRVLEIGDRDRAERMALEVDPINRTGIQLLAVLQAALDHSAKAMSDITDRFTSLERNRLFGAARALASSAPAPAENQRLRLLEGAGGGAPSSLRKVV